MVSVVPFIVGVAICVWLGMRVWQGLVQFDNSLLRIVVPGEKMIVLSNPGEYTVFHEHRSVIKGVVYSSSEDSISGMNCEMRNYVTKEDVPLKASSANLTYAFGSKEGRAIYEFNAGKGGTFQLNCSYPEPERRGMKTVFAIGQGFGASIFNTISYIFTIIAIFIVSFGASAAAIVYLIVKKRGKQEGA
jgi:hypothetical protein